MVVVDFVRLEIFFNHLNLGRITRVLMGVYYRVGPGRSPFDPLGLLRFIIVHVLKGYRSQRALERDVRVDSRVRSLCGFDEYGSKPFNNCLFCLCSSRLFFI